MNKDLRAVIVMILIALLAASTTALPTRAQGTVSITPANADRVIQLAVLGYGYSTDVAWSPDGRTLAVGTSAGLLLYWYFVDTGRGGIIVQAWEVRDEQATSCSRSAWTVGRL